MQISFRVLWDIAVLCRRRVTRAPRVLHINLRERESPAGRATLFFIGPPRESAFSVCLSLCSRRNEIATPLLPYWTFIRLDMALIIGPERRTRSLLISRRVSFLFFASFESSNLMENLAIQKISTWLAALRCIYISNSIVRKKISRRLSLVQSVKRTREQEKKNHALFSYSPRSHRKLNDFSPSFDIH